MIASLKLFVLMKGQFIGKVFWSRCWCWDANSNFYQKFSLFQSNARNIKWELRGLVTECHTTWQPPVYLSTSTKAGFARSWAFRTTIRQLAHEETKAVLMVSTVLIRKNKNVLSNRNSPTNLWSDEKLRIVSYKVLGCFHTNLKVSWCSAIRCCFMYVGQVLYVQLL